MAEDGLKRLNCLGTPIDYTGQKFGKLTALEYIKGEYNKKIRAKWRCQCECGNIVDVDLQKLRSGSITACDKCDPDSYKIRTRNNIIQDITRQKFGKLTVLKQYDVDNKHLCYCRCDCGKEKLVLYYNLLHGGTTSCGCQRKKRKLHNEDFEKMNETQMNIKLQPITNYNDVQILGNSINSTITTILNLPHITDEDVYVIKIKLETLKELNILTDMEVEFYLMMVNKDRPVIAPAKSIPQHSEKPVDTVNNTTTNVMPKKINIVRSNSVEEKAPPENVKQSPIVEEKTTIKNAGQDLSSKKPKSATTFYKVSEFAEKVGVTRQTLINWSKEGKFVEHHRTPSGHRFYSEEQLRQLTHMTPEEIENS